MSSKTIGVGKKDDQFWKEFPTMADYFSPAIQPLLNFAGVSSKEVMHEIGESVGKSVARKLASPTPAKLLESLSLMWEKYEVGRLTVESSNPLVIQLSNCTVCGQLPGTGEMYECAFHEGFFQGALSSQIGKMVTLHQETNFEGEAGTWCRRLAADISI